MADIYWIGGAAAVAQVDTGSIDSVDATPANNTFSIAVGDETVTVTGDTDVNTTATALRAAANASTHPHMAAITFGGASGSITATADTAGAPFTATLSVAGAGTGSITNFSNTTASAGPADWSTAANWSGGSVPTGSDNVIVDKKDEKIAYGLDQSAVTLGTLALRNNLKLGLPWNTFATSADGQTPNSTVREYRDTFLKIKFASCSIGEFFGVGSTVAPSRLKLDDQSTVGSVTTVHALGSTTDSGSPTMRFKSSDADCDLFVLSATGGIGIGVEPGDTVTLGDLSVDDTSSSTRVQFGDKVTLSTFSQRGGSNLLQCNATLTSMDVEDGSCRILGDFTITTANWRGGEIIDNHVKSAGNAITTLNLNGATADFQRSSEPRTVGTLNYTSGTLRGSDALTITTFNEPTAGEYSISI